MNIKKFVTVLTVFTAAGIRPGVLPAEEAAHRPWKSWVQWALPNDDRTLIPFPRGDVFVPPLADQKQPRSHVTWQRFKTSFGTYNVGSVGFGENIGLLRRAGANEGNGVQFGISGAVLALFNLDADSTDLLNADYIVGFPFSVRKNNWSGRLRLFHLSSHLGDEFLMNRQPLPQPQRINLSYETAELLGSYDRGAFRLYGGPSWIVSSVTSIGRTRLQGGAEVRGKPTGWRRARFVSAAEISGWSETAWQRDISVKAGLMFFNPFDENRGLQFLLEYFNGHAPHGQFYPLQVEYWGAGVAFGF